MRIDHRGKSRSISRAPIRRIHGRLHTQIARPMRAGSRRTLSLLSFTSHPQPAPPTFALSRFSLLFHGRFGGAQQRHNDARLRIHTDRRHQHLAAAFHHVRAWRMSRVAWMDEKIKRRFQQCTSNFKSLNHQRTGKQHRIGVGALLDLVGFAGQRRFVDLQIVTGHHHTVGWQQIA